MSGTCAGEPRARCREIRRTHGGERERERQREKERVSEWEWDRGWGEGIEGTADTNMANRLKAMHRRYVRQSASWHDVGAFNASVSTTIDNGVLASLPSPLSLLSLSLFVFSSSSWFSSIGGFPSGHSGDRSVGLRVRITRENRGDPRRFLAKIVVAGIRRADFLPFTPFVSPRSRGEETLDENRAPGKGGEGEREREREREKERERERGKERKREKGREREREREKERKREREREREKEREEQGKKATFAFVWVFREDCGVCCTIFDRSVARFSDSQ